MARKLRLQFEGAVYHVISRGNYRAHVFANEATKAAFLTCLDEACGKSGWVVHAWCVMSNHYHLCLETPRANLVEGMRWLQSTFAIRFNRFREERGHLFQGRYKALLVAPEAVGSVCHYIHLNPVRARLVPAAGLADWRWTSAAQLCHPRQRPKWVSFREALTDAGGLDDTPAGRRNYIGYLGALQEDAAGQQQLEFDRLSKGWAVGAREFKQALLQAHGELWSRRREVATEMREIAETLWSERLDRYLRAVGKTVANVRTESKGAVWKVAIASAMKQTTTAPNAWLARRLTMGSMYRLSRLVTASRQRPVNFEPYVTKIAKCKV